MDQLGADGIVTTIIHLVFKRNAVVLPENEGDQQWHIACMDRMTEFHQTQFHLNYQRSDDPRAVTCPACKRTDVYKQVMDLFK